MQDPEGTLPDFSGKIVWFIDLAGAHDPNGILMECPEFRWHGQRLFVHGRMASFIQGWLAGVEAAIAWDSVVQYLVFRSVDDYRDRAAKAPAQQGKTGLFKRKPE